MKLKAKNLKLKAMLGFTQHQFNKLKRAIEFYRNKTGAGFTLLELMIVVAILSLLSAGIITVLNPYEQIQKSNDGRRKSDLSQIQKALELYYEDNGRYPLQSDDGSYQIVGVNQNILPWGSPWIPYMNLLPKDPSSSKKYVYIIDSTGQAYFLYASLDRGAKDKQACNNGLACQNIPPGAEQACGDTCNYGVSSPNVSP